MRMPEQMKMKDLAEQATVGDVALYGGLVAPGFALALAGLAYVLVKTGFKFNNKKEN